MGKIVVEKQGAVGMIQINRPEKKNAFTLEMFRLFTDAFTQLEEDASVRAVVVQAAGADFTTGLDLQDVALSFSQGQRPFAETAVDPWEAVGRARKKPMVLAVQGRCFTLGFELVLAADTCIASRDAIFALREVRMGIVPAGGGIVRMLDAVGWSSTMRYALTGDEMSAMEALRLHLVQEVVEAGEQGARAMALAKTMSEQPPLAVSGVLEHAHRTLGADRRGAMEDAIARGQALLNTEDAREAAMALWQGRAPVFRGR